MKDLNAGIRREKILYALKQNGKMQMSELAERFGVNKRTIQRDIDALSSSYPIRSIRGNAGGIKLMKGALKTNEFVNTNIATVQIIQRIVDSNEEHGMCQLTNDEIEILKLYIATHEKK